MIEVEVMQDELSISHQHRLAWVNNCKSTLELTALISRTLTEQGHTVSDIPKLNQLALVSNKPPTDYANKHSMLASLRVAAKSGSDMPHGSDNAHSFTRRLGMQVQCSGSYCCIKCIEKDLQNWNFSWYRRMHHLIGVGWCHIHGCSLSKIDSQVPFSQLPHIWLSENKLVPVDAYELNLQEAGFLSRYVEVTTKLLARERPFRVENMKKCLAKRAKYHNLRIGKIGRNPLISDRLFELAPIDWLQEYLPECNKKIPMKYIHRIDSLVLFDKFAGAGDAYAMVITALYDSAEEAFVDLNLAESIDADAEKAHKKASKRGTKFWTGEIWDHYIKSKGVYADIARRLQYERTHLNTRMSELGLPSLHNIDKSATWRAFERFMDGESFAESCASEKIEHAELEGLLRSCSARVEKAIKKIRPKVGRFDQK